MKTNDIFHFSKQNLMLHPMRSILTTMGIVIGIGLFVFFAALSEGIREAALLETLKSYSKTQITVTPSYTNIGIFQVSHEKLNAIDNEKLQAFEGIPGVKAVYPQLTLPFPTSTRVHMFGFDFQTDSPVFGINPEIFNDLPEIYEKFSKADAEPMPVLISSHLINIFNSSIAESNNLPRMNQSAVGIRNFQLLLNHSTFIGSALPQDIDSQEGHIVGTTERVPLMGITIPIDRALEFLKKYKPEINQDDMQYRTVHVLADNVADVATISEAIEGMGFTATSAQETIDQINNILGYFFVIFSIITVIVLIVSACSIVNTISMSVISRIKEIGILRACGATKKEVGRLFFTESVIMGLVGAIVGTLIGVLGSSICNLVLLRVFPDVSYKPVAFFAYSWWIFPVALAISLVISSIGGFFPSRKAASLDPMQALFSSS